MDGLWTDNSDGISDGARDGLRAARNNDADYLFGATALGFDPDVPGDWSGPPEDVAAALDELAAAGVGSLPVVDTTDIVKGSADATKHLRFEVDTLTAGTTRVITMADADIDLADFNAHRLDGLHVGTSGSAIPALDAANTISANWRIASGSALEFYDATGYISGGALALNVNAPVTLNLRTGGSIRASQTSSELNIYDRCRASMFRADGNATGIVTTFTIGMESMAPVGSATLVGCLMGGKTGPANGAVDLLIGCYYHTTKYWLMLLQDGA